MKKLGKKIQTQGKSIEAFACSCGDCIACSCSSLQRSQGVYNTGHYVASVYTNYRK